MFSSKILLFLTLSSSGFLPVDSSDCYCEDPKFTGDVPLNHFGWARECSIQNCPNGYGKFIPEDKIKHERGADRCPLPCDERVIYKTSHRRMAQRQFSNRRDSPVMVRL